MQKHMDDQSLKTDGTFCLQHLTLPQLGHPQLNPARRQPIGLQAQAEYCHKFRG
jgi:hypothetical protein